MNKLDLVLWIVGGGFTIFFGLMMLIWNSINSRFDKVDERFHIVEEKLTKKIDSVEEKVVKQIDSVEEKLTKKIDSVEERLTKKIDSVEEKLTKRIDSVETVLSSKIEKLDEKVTDVDRRLCRLEGAFSSKDCCMIKDSSHIKKVE